MISPASPHHNISQAIARDLHLSPEPLLGLSHSRASLHSQLTATLESDCPHLKHIRVAWLALQAEPIPQSGGMVKGCHSTINSPSR